MAKLIDYFSLTVTLFLLTFVWSALAFDSAAGALIFSSALTMAAVVTVRYVKSKKGKPYPYDRLALELSVRGSEYQVQLLKSIIKNGKIESGDNYILLKNSIVVAAYKFTSLGAADMSAIVRLCDKLGVKHAYVLARGIDRRAYAVMQALGVRVTLIRLKAFYKLLEKRSALPDLKPIKRKFSLRAFLSAALSRSNLRSYLFSGAVLVLVSFITPLRIYYLVIGSISLLLALLTLTPLGSGSVFSPKLSDELREADDIEYFRDVAAEQGDMGGNAPFSPDNATNSPLPADESSSTYYDSDGNDSPDRAPSDDSHGN